MPYPHCGKLCAGPSSKTFCGIELRHEADAIGLGPQAKRMLQTDRASPQCFLAQTAYFSADLPKKVAI
jgi:hypothetical protein